jgi:hypothetical protein
LDLFLQIELLANSEKLRLFAKALDRLEFIPVETAKYYQFIRLFEGGVVPQKVKIDLLSGPPNDVSGLRLEDNRRIKSRDTTIAVHTRRTEEAVAIQEEAIVIKIQGYRLNGGEAQGIVFLPNTFSYLLMKIHAFRDKEEGGDRESASKHAADLYQILALTTEVEWEAAKRLRLQHSLNPSVQKAEEIVREQFTASEQLGVIRLREYSSFFRQVIPTDFSSILTELFLEI